MPLYFLELLTTHSPQSLACLSCVYLNLIAWAGRLQYIISWIGVFKHGATANKVAFPLFITVFKDA